MPAITKDHLLIEKAANAETVANLRNRLGATQRQAELIQIELSANIGAGQFIDHLLGVADLPDEPPEGGTVSPPGDGPAGEEPV